MRVAALGLFLCAGLRAATGAAEPHLSAFDDFVNGLLAKWRIPGAAISVSHNGRLVLARGYGMADVETGRPVQPDSLFEIAGVSRSITAAAILRLAEDGKLSLDDAAFAGLAGSDARTESRAGSLTIRELLHKAMEQPAPAKCGGTAPGPADAGTADASCLLVGIVEKASGQTHETYVRSAVLTPSGISRMRIGRSASEHDEVRYYNPVGTPIDAAGGWVASAIDLLRFANSLDGRRPAMLLKRASLDAMVARPPQAPPGTPNYAGLGWMVELQGADVDWRSSGGTPGSSAFLLRQAASGVDVALLFNSRPSNGGAFDAEVAAGLARTANSIAEWPSTDLFVNGPELFARDLVNGADYSGGRVSPGEIVILYPSNAGPEVLAGSRLSDDGKVATSTGETRVLFDGVAAPMASSVKGRIGAVVPYEIANRKTTQVVVEYQGVRSPPVTLPVVESAPAVYTLDASGKGQAAMLNETGCCNSVRNPAAQGRVAVLYATGEGQTTPPGIDGDLYGIARTADLPRPVLPVAVTVGGIPAEITFAGEAPHAVAGLLQVNFRVPAGAPMGDAVPLMLRVGNSPSADGVTMAVRSSVQRVLIVDSQSASRIRLTGILKGAGYEVLPARDGREAVAQAGQHAIDLVICDLAAPEAERLEMIRAIGKERRQLKIMATAGALGPATLRTADLLGAQAVIVKPLLAGTVLRRVRELLRAHVVPYVAGEDAAPSPARLPDSRIPH